jgi:hypothetical protein
MEKFICLLRGGNYAGKSPNELQLHLQKWLTWVKKLNSDGTFISSDPLQIIGKQIIGAKKIITDKPFGEDKEIINGYFVINAKDMAEATEIAKDCPMLEVDGKLEIRPIQNLEIPN